MTARQMKACTKGGEAVLGCRGPENSHVKARGVLRTLPQALMGALPRSLGTVASPDGSLCVKLTQVWEEGLGLVGGIRRQLWSLGQGRWAE